MKKKAPKRKASIRKKDKQLTAAQLKKIAAGGHVRWTADQEGGVQGLYRR